MGFGGAALAMITSLKNNSRRNKREAFEGMATGTDLESQGVPIEPITEEALQEIQKKLKQQQQLLFRKQMLVYGIVLVMVVLGSVYIIKEPVRILKFLLTLGM